MAARFPLGGTVTVHLQTTTEAFLTTDYGFSNMADVAVVCLSINQAAALARARKRVEAGPFAELAGYADGRARDRPRCPEETSARSTRRRSAARVHGG